MSQDNQTQAKAFYRCWTDHDTGAPTDLDETTLTKMTRVQLIERRIAKMKQKNNSAPWGITVTCHNASQIIARKHLLMCTTYPTYINMGAGLNTNERESTNHQLLTYLEDEKNSLANGCDDDVGMSSTWSDPAESGWPSRPLPTNSNI